MKKNLNNKTWQDQLKDVMKPTLLIIKDKLSRAQFTIFEETQELAQQALNSFELNLEEFDIDTFHDGKIFDHYLESSNKNKDNVLSPAMLLKKLIEAERDGHSDTETIHWEADYFISQALDKSYKVPVEMFNNMEKWYA